MVYALTEEALLYIFGEDKTILITGSKGSGTTNIAGVIMYLLIALGYKIWTNIHFFKEENIEVAIKKKKLPYRPTGHYVAKHQNIIIAKKLKPYPTELYSTGVDIISSDISRSALGNSIYGHKLMNYFENLYAKDHAYSQGAFEAFFLTKDKLVLEGSTTNIFMVNGNIVYTPPLTQNILPGITRKVVLDICRGNSIRVREKKLHYRDLIGAAEVFLTNSVAEIIPVKKVDIHNTGRPVPGDITSRLLNLYRVAVSQNIQ